MAAGCYPASCSRSPLVNDDAAAARRRPFPDGRAYICPGERCGVDTTGTETNLGFWGHCAVCAGVLCAAEIRFSRNGRGGGDRGGRIVWGCCGDDGARTRRRRRTQIYMPNNTKWRKKRFC